MNPAMMVGEVVINDLVEEGFLKVTGGLEFPVASQSTQRKLPVASQSLHGDTINWVPVPGGGQGEPSAVGPLVCPGRGGSTTWCLPKHGQDKRDWVEKVNIFTLP